MAADPYLRLGRLYADYVDLHDEYRNLLNLVARIKRGEVSAEHVEILPNNSWQLITPPANE